MKQGVAAAAKSCQGFWTSNCTRPKTNIFVLRFLFCNGLFEVLKN